MSAGSEIASFKSVAEICMRRSWRWWRSSRIMLGRTQREEGIRTGKRGVLKGNWLIKLNVPLRSERYISIR